MLLEVSSSPIRFEHDQESETRPPEPSRVGNSVYQFSIDLAYVASLLRAIDPTDNEMSDAALLVAADKAGTFDFLKSPEEAIYDDLVK